MASPQAKMRIFHVLLFGASIMYGNGDVQISVSEVAWSEESELCSGEAAPDVNGEADVEDENRPMESHRHKH